VASRDIITIDGPSGAGKSTLAADLASRLGWRFLDTGVLYRAVGLAALEGGVSLKDHAALGALAGALAVKVALASGKSRVFLGEREVTGLIRAEAVSAAASAVSAAPAVRESVRGLQLALGAEGRLVTEGRDQGTAIFPEARLKFFLTAGAEARARRRWLDLKKAGSGESLEEVLEKIIRRDQADESREAAPLRAAPGAVTIDSTSLSRGEVLRVMEEKARGAFPELLGS
jgi:cytidylate kinase